MLLTSKDDYTTDTLYLHNLLYVLSVIMLSHNICMKVCLYTIVICTKVMIIIICPCLLWVAICAVCYWLGKFTTDKYPDEYCGITDVSVSLFVA